MCGKCKQKHEKKHKGGYKEKDKKENKNGGKSFYVTVGPKSRRHPFYGQGSELGYEINGVSGAPLYLKKGKTYTFHIDAAGHPFYFTTSDTGGTGQPTGNLNGSPVMRGTLIFHVGNNLPSRFYYQCMLHPKMGGYVYIQDYDSGCNCKLGGPCRCGKGMCNCGKKQNQIQRNQVPQNRMTRYQIQQNQMQMEQVMAQY